MLKHLKYKATFSSTGKSLSGDHHFQTGLTAITGPNESGKSMIVEMIRYGLFGTKALRTSVSAFDQLVVDVSFTLPAKGDTVYKVSRSKSGTDVLSCDNVRTVSGTKPVNEAIEKLLGYNLEVFDVSNACLQGEVEALSKKTPAERKRMVERTIGLHAIEKVIKNVNEKTSLDKRSHEALQSTLHSVEEPEKPKDYVETQTFKTIVDKKEEEYKEFIQLSSWLLNSRVEQPVKPQVTSDTLENLLEKQETFETISNRINYLHTKMENLPTDCAVSNFALRRKLLSDYIMYERHLAQYPEPIHSPEFLAEQIQLLTDRDIYLERKDLKERIATLEDNTIECPDCKSVFPLENSTVNELKEKLSSLSQIDEEPKGIQLNVATIESTIEAWKQYDARPKVEPVDKPDDTLEAITKHEIEWGKYQEYLKHSAELQTQYDLLAGRVDQSEAIRLKRKEIEDIEKYESDNKKYLDFIDRKDTVEQRLTELESIEEQVVAHRDRLQQYSNYEVALGNYKQQKAVMDDRQSQIDEIMERINRNENVKKGLKDLKPKVKMFLVPSLNKVSSILISQMTQGERNSIVIDEEFNIKVDGQAIEELSGSGKSVANLAIRIGLGTVLTNKVFSLFLADEVDAAMDADRASYTAECLRNLKSTIKQVIIVSHQKPEADHQIELRK
jgi:DNA repair exonuclease SbcCD ATPase subunit